MSKFIFTFLLLALTNMAFGQPVADTTFLRTSVLNAEKTYHIALSKQLNIHNGRGYKTYSSTSDEHPYFLTDDWIIGSMIYESDYYGEVPILYDLSSEKIISENPINGAKMELVYDKIERFEIRDHHFIKVHKDFTSPVDMSEGFYEILYDGKLKLYAQRRKNLQTITRGNVMYPEFEEKNKYFLFNGKSFSRVSGKKSILKSLDDKEKLPKPTTFKTDPNSPNKLEDKLIFLTKFYDLHTSSL